MQEPMSVIKQLNLSGGLVIPNEMRIALGWQGGSYVKIIAYEDHLELRTAEEKEGVLRELYRMLQGMDEESLWKLLRSIYLQKKKQGRSH